MTVGAAHGYSPGHTLGGGGGAKMYQRSYILIIGLWMYPYDIVYYYEIREIQVNKWGKC